MANNVVEMVTDGRTDRGSSSHDSMKGRHLALSARTVLDIRCVTSVYPGTDVYNCVKTFFPVLGTYPWLPGCVPMDVGCVKHVQSSMVKGDVQTWVHSLAARRSVYALAALMDTLVDVHPLMVEGNGWNDYEIEDVDAAMVESCLDEQMLDDVAGKVVSLW